MPPPLPVSTPWNDLVDRFLTWLRHNRGRSAATATSYLKHLQRWGEYAGDRDPLSLSVSDIEDFTGLWAHRLGLSPRTRRPMVAAVRGMLAWARRQGLEVINPDDVPYPSCGRRLPTPATLASAERLLMACDTDTFIGLRDAAMIATLAGCGFRLSGLTRLDREDLILTNHGASERLIAKVREKGGNDRLVPVPVEAAVLIRAYLGHPELAKVDTTLPSGRNVLWVTLNNRSVPEHNYRGELRRISARTVQQSMARYGRRAGIPREHCHPHALRHLFGTELAEAGVDLLERQQLMGHKDPKNTEIYTHLAVRRLVDVVDRGSPLGKLSGGLARTLRRLGSAPTGAGP